MPILAYTGAFVTTSVLMAAICVCLYVFTNYWLLLCALLSYTYITTFSAILAAIRCSILSSHHNHLPAELAEITLDEATNEQLFDVLTNRCNHAVLVTSADAKTDSTKETVRIMWSNGSDAALGLLVKAWEQLKS